MTVINPNSISGITSITLPSGSDNVLTIHTNDGVERFRIDSTGNIKVGSAATISPDGDLFVTGVTTTGGHFAGSGANLTSLPAANLTGTLPAISAANLTNIPAANITGTLPAISGANLTGITAGVLAMQVKLDGTRGSYTEEVDGNNFTDGRNLSGLSITMTPTNATTIFLITGNIYVTHSPSFMGKGYVTTQISGGNEQMIAGNGDSSHRATFPISDGDAGTGITGTGKTFTLFYDHNTTSAVTFRVRVGTTNTGYPNYYNRGADGATNDNDGVSMISSLMVQEIDSSIFTGTDSADIYRGT